MRLTCGKCDNGWICEEHPTSRGRMMTAAGRVCRAKPSARLQHHRNWSGLPDLSPRTKRDQPAVKHTVTLADVSTDRKTMTLLESHLRRVALILKTASPTLDDLIPCATSAYSHGVQHGSRAVAGAVHFGCSVPFLGSRSARDDDFGLGKNTTRGEPTCWAR